MLLLTCSTVQAQAHRLGASAPGLLEAGTPQFSIREHEALGLDSPPTDMQLLPDGRIVVLAPHQLAFGDGLRWEVFQQSPEDAVAAGSTMAIDPSGGIYIGVRGAFAKVEFGDNGQWRLKVVAKWEGAEEQRHPILTTVTAIGHRWFWHGESGPLIAWTPGATPEVLGRADTIEQVFQLGNDFFLSDRTNGSLWRIGAGRLESIAFAPRFSASDTFTCAVPFDDRTMLVGTWSRGLRLFDGKTTRPFAMQAGLSDGIRINDLCVTESGVYAATVENVGIVFFDRDGRTIQVLDRTIDHRLADIRRLLRVPGATLLGLLGDGLLRVGFPSRISNFEPLIGTGVATGHPYRLDGKLWIMADGNIFRGVYDEHERLTKIEIDTPPGRFSFAFSTDLGLPVVGTDRGAYYRSPGGWVEFAPDSVNLRILDPQPTNGRWIYGAKDEVGWIRYNGLGLELERIPMRGLDNLYNTETGRDGWIWIEQGNARLGRLRMEGTNRATLDMFGPKNGIPEGWAQVFSLDGDVLFNVGGEILDFDEARRSFVPAPRFHRQFPGLTGIIGRPARDAAGRVWITANGGVQIWQRGSGETWHRVNEEMPPGFQPYYFAMEASGVVWMHRDRRLARYDPHVPTAPSRPLRALITGVTLSGSGRSITSVGDELRPLTFDDNSLVVHFVAPNAPLGTAVNFEVMLEGSDSRWVTTGAVGSAAFNHLKEGSYILHVRPRTGATAGGEAFLRFTILPPWYRSSLAYALYLAAAGGLALAVGRVLTLLQRRENARLERLVAQRTRELNASHEQLTARVEEVRMLSQAIEQSPIAVFMVRPDGTIAFANPRACEMNGYALTDLLSRNVATIRDRDGGDGAADMAACLSRGEAWHGQLTNRRKDGAVVRVRSLVVPIRNGDGTLRHHLVMEEDVSDWLREQERRRRLESQLFQAQKLESLGTLAGGIAHDFNNILTGMLGYCELAKLSAGNNDALLQDLEGVRNAGLRARDLVKQILTFSRQSNARLEPLNIAAPVDETLRLVRASTPATVDVVASLQPGTIRGDATQIQQLVLNLCTNAVQALPNQAGRVAITLQPIDVGPAFAAEVPNLKPGPHMHLVVADNGRGMEPSTLDRIFDPFFTTKPQGEGTGLGLAIVQGILTAHGAARRVQSTPGEGSTFEFFFPQTGELPPQRSEPAPAPAGSQENILVVDDENFVAMFAAKRLSQLGYVPTVFTEARAALAAVATAPHRFDAIVTDLTMPHLTGADLIMQIRTHNPDLPAVIVTGYGRDAARARLAALPRCLVLPKPYTGDELAGALREVLGHGGQQTPP